VSDCKCGDCDCSGKNLADHIAEDECMVWSTSAQSTAQAKGLWMIRAIVDKYGGTVEIDIQNNLLNIDFPDSVSAEDEAKCALEVEEAMDEAGFCI